MKPSKRTKRIPKALDPITLEVVSNRLQEISRTMEHILFHTGYSTILRESQDGSAGITDREGNVIGGAAGETIHLTPYVYTVKGVLENYRYDEMEAGDTFVVNDPYKGGSHHVPDVAVATPVMYRGQVIAFTSSIAHKPDVGGMVPGSSSAASREIFHEGLLLPPMKYWSKGKLIKEVDLVIRNNCRTPDLTAGDLRGQAGCTQVGARMLCALCDEYGVDTVLQCFAELQNVTEKRLRAELAILPDGEREAESFLDHDSADPDKPVRIHVRIIKQGSDLTIDFSGCAPQTRGPVNLPQHSAEASCLVALVSFLDPTIPFNEGLRRAVTFISPPGKVVHPIHPGPVNHYFPTNHQVYNCMLSALSALDPGRAVGEPGGGSGAVAFGYRRTRTGKSYVQYEIMCTGLGGHDQGDGGSMYLPVLNFTPFTPIEILETEYPVRVTEFSVRTNSAGPGKARGGLGYIREYETLDDAILTARSSQHKHTSKGVLGGRGPIPTRCSVTLANGDTQVLPTISTIHMKAGDRFKLEQSGGGGYGDPLTRDPTLVLDDALNGYVSIEKAAEEYGVIIDPDRLTIDHEATRQLRQRPQRRG